MSARKNRWLRRQLNLRLMLPLLAIVAATGALGAYAAQRLVDRVFDRWLLDGARSLGGQIEFADGRAQLLLSRQAETLLTYDIIDSSYYEVVQDGRHLLGQRGLPSAGAREALYAGGDRAYDARYAGADVRVAAVRVGGPGGATAEVRFAETLRKRQSARADLLLAMAPMAILVLLAAAVIGAVVRSTINPLERIAARWNARSHVSLEPIEVDDVPRELLPFATALNDLLQRVQTMLERQQQFAANVAHQLRTPLTGLSLGLARAAEAPDVASVRAILRDMGATTQRTARVVQQLLALSRLGPEAGAKLRLGSVDLVALAREVGESYLDPALAKGITLEFSADAEQLSVIGSADLLAEALGNLLDNALRYTPAGGHTLIAVDAQRRSLSVADSGPGLSADERETVFGRFIRGQASAGDGSGLGLSIVSEIASLHGAHVFAASSPLGGACIVLQFGPD